MKPRKFRFEQRQILSALEGQLFDLPLGLKWLKSEHVAKLFVRAPNIGNSFLISDSHIGSLHLKKEHRINSRNLIFDNCQVDELIIENFEVSDLIFRNSYIQGITIKEGAYIKTIDFQEKSVVSRFEVEGTETFIEEVNVEGKMDMILFSLTSARIGVFKLYGESEIERIELTNQAKLDHFEHEAKLIRYFRSEKQSVLQSLRVTKGIIGVFELSAESSSNSILIRNKSEIGDIRIFSQSRIEEVIYLSESKVQSISVSNSSAHRVLIEQSSNVGTLEFNNEASVGPIEIKDNSNVDKLSLKSNSKVDALSLSNSYCGNISIPKNCGVASMNVYEKSFVGKIDISHNHEMSNLIVIGESVLGDLLIDSAKIGYIQISRSYCRDVKLTYCTSVTRLRIEDTWSGKLDISDCEMASVHLKNFQNSVVLEKWNISSFRVSQSTLPRFSTKGQASGEILFADSNINHLDLRATNIPTSCSLSFVRCGSYVTQMEYLNVLGPTFFRKFQALEKPVGWINDESSKVLGKLKKKPAKESAKYFDEKKKLLTALSEQNKEMLFEREGALQIKHPSSLFSLVHSTLGKSEFSQCDFDSFSSFRYYNSKFTDSYIPGSKFPRSSKIVIHDSANVVSDTYERTNQLMSFYNQLKKVLESQGDNVVAGRYHAKAMQQQSILLKNTKLEYDTSDNFFDRKWTWLVHYSDRFTFGLNGLSSRHGDSWFRAFVFIIIATLISFALYNIAAAAYGLVVANPFKPSNWYFLVEGLSQTWFYKKYLFEFFLPIHRFDFMEDTISTNAWTASIDFISRIIIGYGIYQFIAAFRRHGRRT